MQQEWLSASCQINAKTDMMLSSFVSVVKTQVTETVVLHTENNMV